MLSVRLTAARLSLLLLAIWGVMSVPTANAQSNNATQIVFALTGGSYNYTIPNPPKDTAFGFWIWCSGPSGTTPYEG